MNKFLKKFYLPQLNRELGCPLTFRELKQQLYKKNKSPDPSGFSWYDSLVKKK